MTTAFASFPFSLPENLRYDGVQGCGGSVRFLQFTELDEKSPSHGATFYIEAGPLLAQAITERRAAVGSDFSKGSTTPQEEIGHA